MLTGQPGHPSGRPQRLLTVKGRTDHGGRDLQDLLVAGPVGIRIWSRREGQHGLGHVPAQVEARIVHPDRPPAAGRRSDQPLPESPHPRQPTREDRGHGREVGIGSMVDDEDSPDVHRRRTPVGGQGDHVVSAGPLDRQSQLNHHLRVGTAILARQADPERRLNGAASRTRTLRRAILAVRGQPRVGESHVYRP